MTRYARPVVLSVLMLAATVTPAAADITAFWGLSPTPATRSVRGFAAGVTLVVFGFEFEFARTAEGVTDSAPSLTTGMINGVIQTPTRTQFYVTAGGGVFREQLDGRSETLVGTNVGGGLKMPLVGPLRLRLDYRVFNLRGQPLHQNPQRFYAGVNLGF